MSDLRKIYLFTKHEIFSEITDFKVISLVVLALINILIILNLSYDAFIHNTLTNIISSVPMKYLWVTISYSSTFFVYLIGIVVGGEIFSKDFERNISDTLYTLPISRLDIFFSKILGGLVVSYIYTIIIEASSIISAYAVFGDLLEMPIDIISVMAIACLVSQLTFYSISIYLGIKIRKKLTAIVISIVLVLFLPLIDYYIDPIYQMKNAFINFFIDMIPHRALDLPISIAYELLGISTSHNIVNPINAIISVTIYTVVFISISMTNFLKADYI